MSGYRKVVEKLAEQSGGDGNRLPCITCKASTLHSVLAHLGARCQSCYDAYCRAAGAERTPFVGDKRRDGDRAWAHAMQSRDQAGQQLTPFQRQAGQRALRHRVEPPDDDSSTRAFSGPDA